jgi:hypothetical protein
MAIMKQVSIDGEDVEIESMSDGVLLSVIRLVSADLTAAALSDGKPFLGKHPLHETEAYRLLRVQQLTAKRKALLLEARRRKLEIE